MNKSFPFSQKAINQSLIFGGILLLCGIAIVFLGRLNLTAMIFGLLLLLMGFWQKSNSPVTLLDDHLVLKPAPIAPKRLILYSDIQSLGGDLTKKAFLMVNDAGKEKKIVLPFQALSAEHRQELVADLQSKMKKN